MSPTLRSETKDGEKPGASGDPGAGSADAEAELLLKVAAMCDAVTQRLAVQQSREPELHPQLTVPVYTGYNDAKSIADFLPGGNPDAKTSTGLAQSAQSKQPEALQFWFNAGEDIRRASWCRRLKQGPRTRGGPSPRGQQPARPTPWNRCQWAGRARDTGSGLCRRCRERPQRTATTWTVLVEDISRGWASDLNWDDQPRPERAGPSQAVSEPFRGQTLEERHPTEPAAHYTSEEMRLLCPLCGVPEICRATHLRGALHGERADAERIARINRLGDRGLERAIALI
ncbi:hypothetical protein HPB47_016447 [Ixodes persulcatus]|uniref:Uncharacterized protein n=1 Tax=Ixodes persulcatus TaxID=34615 RepID=A0AC60QQX2_IXOPE|nr:hypothetical protein HPB47_016447 [Ixodes persulcatus]